MPNKPRINAREGLATLKHLITRKTPQNHFALNCNPFAGTLKESTNNETLTDKQEGLCMLIFCTLCLMAAVLLTGCSTTPPTEYEMDTTPLHNGEHWQGGE